MPTLLSQLSGSFTGSMQDIPPDVFEQIREALCRTEGTFFFEYESESFLDPEPSGGRIFEMAAGGHVFRLEYTNELLLRYYYASPGTGTRVATIDLKDAPRCSQAFIAFCWSPREIQLHFGPRAPNAELLIASGVPSKKQFRVGKDGGIYQIGDEGVDVLSTFVYQSGKLALGPTAIEAWRSTKQAIEVLSSGTSSVGYMYEVVVTNMTLSVLVTGFEAYTKTRFKELEDEGINPDSLAVVDSFFSKREREAGIALILEAEATESGITLLSRLIQRSAINFQNYGDCKKAYSKAYGIRFGEIGIQSEILAQLQQFIRYRHQVIHVSLMLGLLNQSEVPLKEPVFPDRALAESALSVFNLFIGSLHAATLSLRRKD